MATLQSQIDRQDAPAKQAPIEHVRVRGIQVGFPLPAIHRYLYDEDVGANWTPLNTEFDYRWQIVKDGQFLHLSIDGESPDWRTEMKNPSRSLI